MHAACRPGGGAAPAGRCPLSRRTEDACHVRLDNTQPPAPTPHPALGTPTLEQEAQAPDSPELGLSLYQLAVIYYAHDMLGDAGGALQRATALLRQQFPLEHDLVGAGAGGGGGEAEGPHYAEGAVAVQWAGSGRCPSDEAWHSVMALENRGQSALRVLRAACCAPGALLACR